MYSTIAPWMAPTSYQTNVSHKYYYISFFLYIQIGSCWCCLFFLPDRLPQIFICLALRTLLFPPESSPCHGSPVPLLLVSPLILSYTGFQNPIPTCILNILPFKHLFLIPMVLKIIISIINQFPLPLCSSKCSYQSPFNQLSAVL